MTVTRGRLGLAVALLIALATVIAAGLTNTAAPPGAGAASHREAPLISLDAPADITDFYFFRSYEPGKGQNVVLIMDTFPGGEPSSGPNYFQFDPSVTYSFEIDNDRDGVADDVRFDVRFSTEIRGLPKDLGLPLSFVGGLGPITRIDSLDHPGVGLRQTYTVTMTKKRSKPVVIATGTTAPPRVGPRTTGDGAEYDALAAQAAVDIDGGGRVWAGPRDDPFAIDLGAIFDSLNLRSVTDTGGVDMLSGFNVQTIALEIPVSWISAGSNILGAYASTSRPEVTVRGDDDGKRKKKDDDDDLVQVQRLANPLVNEVIIGVADKDRWNATSPEKESLFEGYYLKPRVSLALQLASGLDTSCLPLGVPGCAPASPEAAADLGLSNFSRTDLVALLLQYNGVLYGSGPGGAKSDLLRLNFGIEPKPLADQHRLGVLGNDLAGWPNGRRPNDDVTDIAVQAAGGQKYLAGAAVPSGVGDGVSANEKPLPVAFPFLAAPHDGRDRVHSNP